AQVEDSHVPLRDSEEIRRLARRAPYDIAQQENGALPRRERLQREEKRVGGALRQVVARLWILALRQVERVRLGRLDRRGEPGAGVGPAPPAAECVDAEVRGDAREPVRGRDDGQLALVREE